MCWNNKKRVLRRGLLLIVIFVALTFVHELGHIVGLSLCQIKIKYLRVPNWFPRTNLSFVVNDDSGIWSWGIIHRGSKKGHLDFVETLIYALIVPLIFEIIFLKKINQSIIKWEGSFLLLKLSDLNLVYQAFRTFVFLNFGVVISILARN